MSIKLICPSAALKWVLGLPCFKRSLTMMMFKKTDAVATVFLVAAAVYAASYFKPPTN